MAFFVIANPLTLTFLHICVELLVDTIDKSCLEVNSLYTDFSKAFDKINQLSARNMCVRVGKYYSDVANVAAGAPQRSILGLLGNWEFLFVICNMHIGRDPRHVIASF